MTQPTPPAPTPKDELYDRIVEVLGTRDVHPDDRSAIRDAFEAADSWDALPTHIQAKIIELEDLPRQAWDDPADVPDNLDEDTEEEGDGSIEE